jgi:hypothetical protein
VLEQCFAPLLKQHPFFYVLNAQESIMSQLTNDVVSQRTLVLGLDVFENSSKVEEMIFVDRGKLIYTETEVSGSRTSQMSRTSGTNRVDVWAGEWACESALWAERAMLFGDFEASNQGADLLALSRSGFTKKVMHDRPLLQFVSDYAVDFMRSYREEVFPDDCDDEDDEDDDDDDWRQEESEDLEPLGFLNDGWKLCQMVVGVAEQHPKFTCEAAVLHQAFLSAKSKAWVRSVFTSSSVDLLGGMECEDRGWHARQSVQGTVFGQGGSVFNQSNEKHFQPRWSRQSSDGVGRFSSKQKLSTRSGVSVRSMPPERAPSRSLSRSAL